MPIIYLLISNCANVVTSLSTSVKWQSSLVDRYERSTSVWSMGAYPETIVLRTAYWHEILPTLLGRERVRDPVVVVPCRLGPILPRTAKPHPWPLPSHFFRITLSFNIRAGTAVPIVAGLRSSLPGPPFRKIMDMLTGRSFSNSRSLAAGLLTGGPALQVYPRDGKYLHNSIT
jgi:hypothetical protein